MRLFVLGATGHTGAHLLDLGLSRGHAITAFVRNPAKLTLTHPRLTTLRGDPLDQDTLAAALPGHDAVVSALGVRPPGAFRPHTLVGDAAAATVAAMLRSGVSRIALVSAAVLFPEKGLGFAFFRWLLKHIARDLGAAEASLRSSPLAYTVARPPRLIERLDEGYRDERDALPSGGNTMSFRAVAAFLLDAIEGDTHLREIVGLAGHA